MKSFHKKFSLSRFHKPKKLLILMAPTSIYVSRFDECVSDWSILNNYWPIQKIDLHQYGGVYGTVKYLTHAFPEL